jgi:RHS repeat-associated protein
VTRDYDYANRLTLDEQNVNGLGVKDVNYEYDEEGKAIRLYSAAAGYDYTFNYDLRNRFEKIKTTGASNPSFQYYYDGASNETKRSNLINGVDQSYTPIDALNRMTRRDVIDGNGTNLNAEGYTYDAMSRITRVDRSGNDDSVFDYYQDGEIKSGTYVAPELNAVSYVWDKAGNRTSINDGGVNKTYSPNGINQYTSAEGAAVTNGNDHEIAAYGGVTYDYRNDEQLIQATGGGKTYKLAYDALGRCVKRTLNGAVTYFIYDGEKPILEFDSGGNVVGWNLYGKGIDEIIQRGAYAADSSWHWYFPQQNHEGSVTHLTDTNGAVIEKYKYDAFGEPLILSPNNTQLSTSAYNNRFLFTSREWAPGNLGFYEYRARAYHPRLGRFMSEDPKGFDAGDYNLFRYCHNDPIDRTDPMGLLSGFSQYYLAYDPHEKLDATHDGYHVAGVPGTEEKPGGVHLEVDRSVGTVSHLRSGEAAATTVHTTAKDVSGTPTIHQQIDTRYAADAGPKTQSFTRNNEWTHSSDAIKAVNSYRSQVAAWASTMKMSPAATLGMLRNGAQFGNIRVPSVSGFDAAFHWNNANKWDNPIGPNSWLALNGKERVAPHSPIDPESGNPLDYKE